jgi:purine-nucleoside phosphorylase
MEDLMQPTRLQALESAAFIKKHTKDRPEVGILTGTGLSGCAASIETSACLAYETIPHFPVATVTGHPGRLLIGRLQGRATVVLQGRFHLYEGYTPTEVTFPIRVLQELGVETLIVSNAAGGLNRTFEPGDIMIIGDHINLTGANPLVGPNEDAWGDRFPDMGAAYDRGLMERAAAAGRRAGIVTRTGVYAGLAGPSLETPAEVRYLRAVGADAVGFSTVQEVIAAVHAKMQVLGLSTITNVHDPGHSVPATVQAIVRVAEIAAPKVNAVIEGVLAE